MAQGSDLPLAMEEEDTTFQEDEQRMIDASQVVLTPMSQQPLEMATSSLHHQEADVGVIEEITLVDFMCHKRLTVALSPNVNFILGQNGSGKSAIMTAIVVALGGKATTTHRASSLKQFIRTSCRQAEITLKLRNRGQDAYKLELYGPVITVFRQIRDDGSSAYKLKSCKGHVVTTGKEELIRILEWFNIQVDNPVSMLSQDTSRNFLHSSNPSTKYKLFMKGTHLEQIAHDYARTEEQQQLMKSEIRRKKEMLPTLELQAKELEEEVKSIDQLARAEERVRRLNHELLWSVVGKLRGTVEKEEEVLDASRQKLQKNEERVVKGEEKLAGRKQVLDDAKRQLEEAVKEAGEVELRQNQQQNEKRNREKAVREAKCNVVATRRKIAAVEKEKQAFEKRLDELRAQSQRDVAGERETLREDLQRKQEQLTGLEEKLRAAEQDKRGKEEEVQTITAELRRHRMHVDDLRQQISECDDVIGRLQGSQGHALQGYSRWMVDLVSVVRQNQRQFRKPPKGPLGASIKLKEQRWSPAIEAVLGGNLFSFVVDNREDEFQFNHLVRQWMSRQQGPGRKPPSCICSAFEGRMYNTAQHRPRCSYPTVMDLMDVADPDVMNCLIEMCNVDCVLLIADKAEARRVMFEQPPARAKSAYTIEGDQVLPGGRYYSNKMRPQGILRASVQESIDNERRRKESVLQQLKAVEEEERGMQRRLDEGKSMLRRITNYMRNSQSDQRKLRMNMDNLRTQLEEEEQNAEEDITTWESQIQDCEDQLQELRRKREEWEQKVGEKEEELSTHVQEMEQYNRRVQEVQSSVEEMRGSMRKAMEEHDRTRRFVQQCQEKRSTHLASLRQEEEHLQEIKQQAEEARRKAAERCEEIQTSRKPADIQSEIRKLERHLQSQQERRQNQRDIRQRYLTAMETYRRTAEAIESEKETLRALHCGLERRKRDYDELKQRIAQRCVLYFNNYVRRRGYNGALRFDLQNKRLEIIVKVGGAAQVTKNTRSLSGGERSFATVSFIMALWEAIESPFRCLDEFDVFMDLMNRKISMQLMIESADQQRNRQFIFFTPQDMSSLGVQYGANTKILRLNPPDRTQSTLD